MNQNSKLYHQKITKIFRIKDDKKLLLGAYDAKNKKWLATSFNQELKSQTNLNINEIKAYINKASYYYQNASKIENEIIKISNEIEEGDLTGLKNYWRGSRRRETYFESTPEKKRNER